MYVVSGDDDDGAENKLRQSGGSKECQVSEVSLLPFGTLSRASIVRYEDKLLLAGGSSEDQEWEARTWSLDLVSGSWTKGQPNPNNWQVSSHLIPAGQPPVCLWWVG